MIFLNSASLLLTLLNGLLVGLFSSTLPRIGWWWQWWSWSWWWTWWSWWSRSWWRLWWSYPSCSFCNATKVGNDDHVEDDHGQLLFKRVSKDNDGANNKNLPDNGAYKFFCQIHLLERRRSWVEHWQAGIPHLWQPLASVGISHQCDHQHQSHPEK